MCSICVCKMLLPRFRTSFTCTNSYYVYTCVYVDLHRTSVVKAIVYMLLFCLITGVASDRGWSRTQSVPHVDALSVKTWQVGRAKGRRLPREEEVKVEGGMLETGFFISMVPR